MKEMNYCVYETEGQHRSIIHNLVATTIVFKYLFGKVVKYDLIRFDGK